MPDFDRCRSSRQDASMDSLSKDESLLNPPERQGSNTTQHHRHFSTVHIDHSLSDPLVTSHTAPYTQQYANLYFMRLAKLRKRTMARAHQRWADIPGATVQPVHIERVLDVEPDQLCYIIGTVYMEMPSKPSVLTDIANNNLISASGSTENYRSPETDDVLLEDESGRIRLVGDKLKSGKWRFVTGVILSVLGLETTSGDFEVFDICAPGIPSQPHSLSIPPNPVSSQPSPQSSSSPWVAIVSGLGLDGQDPKVDARASLLTEYLSGDLGTPNGQATVMGVSKLLILGDSVINPIASSAELEKKPKRYGYDSSAFNAAPTKAFDDFLSNLLSSLDVILAPGRQDPAAPLMPQQSLQKALFPKSTSTEGLLCVTNPTWFNVDQALFLMTSGQTIDDICKYFTDEDRLAMIEATLEWSHMSPTSPDTLWCYPFQNNDPFIISQAPHVYLVGNQPKFQTSLVTGTDEQKIRTVLVPKFHETCEIVLLNTMTLECRVVSIDME